MKLRIAALLTMTLLAGCKTTAYFRPDELPSARTPTPSGEITIVKSSGDEVSYTGPASASVYRGQVRIDRDLLPSETLESSQVSQIELTTFSPARTAVVVVGAMGVAVAAVTLMALTAEAFSHPISLGGLSGLGHGPLGL